MSTTKMRAPAGANFIYLPDGSKLTIDSNGFIDCPNSAIQVAEAAGFTSETGEFSSSTAGSGVALSASKTFAKRVAADDGGVALTAGSYKANEMRMLLATALAAGDISIFGNEDHLKVVADASLATGHLAGNWGYLEMSATGKVNVAAGVKAMCDLPSGAVVTGVLSALLCASNDLTGTHTGICAAIHVPNPVAGTFDDLIALGSASGCHANGTTKTTPGGVDKWLNINIGGTPYYVPAYASKTA